MALRDTAYVTLNNEPISGKRVLNDNLFTFYEPNVFSVYTILGPVAQ